MKLSLINFISFIIGGPLYLIFFVSDKCWLKCRHCWFCEDWKARNIFNEQLSFTEIEEIARSINKLAFVTFCGGEAFLRDDIVELVKMFLKTTSAKRYQIPTSGFDTDRVVQLTEKILKQNGVKPFRVDVSLDGMESEHDFIRNRKGSFSNAVGTIKSLIKLKRRYPNFDVGIMSTINKYNQNQVHELGQFVSDIVDGGEWMVKIIRGAPRDPLAGQVDADKYFQVHEIIDKFVRTQKSSGHRGHFSAPWLSAKNSVRRTIIHRITTQNYYPGVCSAGSLIGVMNVDGEIRPCEIRDDSIGNIRDYNYHLPRMWRSKKIRDFRKHMINSHCTCTHECVLSTSILLQPHHWYLLLQERLKLSKYQKKLRSP